MTPLEHIRKSVFGVSQQQLASSLDVSQSTISRWENGELSPDHADMKAIRELATQERITWDDRWFFEIPVSHPATIATSAE